MTGCRLTDNIFPAEPLQGVSPEYVAPLVVWLYRETFQETSDLFEFGAKSMAKLCWERSLPRLLVLNRVDQEKWGMTVWVHALTFVIGLNTAYKLAQICRI